MRKVRIALCQIECHPALYLSNISYLEEPFVPSPQGTSLSSLATKGVQVDSLQILCSEEYKSWSLSRLASIFEELANFNPIPDIIVFPEGSVQIDGLSMASTFSSEHGVMVLPGTHTPLSSMAAKHEYKGIGITGNRIKKLMQRGVRNVLPLINGGKIRLIEKKLLSPFEQSIISKPTHEVPTPQSFKLDCSSGQISVLPMICAEALQPVRLPNTYDLVAIISYDHRPNQFIPFAKQQVSNHKLVAYCNDGSAGGTMLYCADDERRPNWLSDTLPNGLPPGDGILVLDLDLDVTTVEVSTATPRYPFQLVALRSIIPEGSDKYQSLQAIEEIRNIQTSEGRAQELSKLLKSEPLTDQQKIRFEFLYELEKRGSPSEDWWTVLGSDCAAMGIAELRQLEARLAKSCNAYLLENGISSAAHSPDASQSLVKFMGQCQDRAAIAETVLEPVAKERQTSTLDREREAEEICSFFDAPTIQVLELTGLPQMGKTVVINKALTQLGKVSSRTIELTDTSTADYIIYQILKTTKSGPEPPYENPVHVARSRSMSRAMRGLSVLCLAKCHLLLDHGIWRDETLEDTLRAILETAAECNTKLIFESQRELPLELESPNIRSRLRIRGLDLQAGQALFDAQLRRVGLSGTAIDKANKEVIVSKVAGHPVAIAIAADAVYEQGPNETIESIRKKQGFFEYFLRRLVRVLELSDEEQIILRLFCLARGDVPREVIVETLSLPSAAPIRNLLALGALEIGQFGMLRIASVLREYFDPTDLLPEQTASFHALAAMALAEISKGRGDDLTTAVEAEYHAGLAEIESPVNTNLIDGALGTARRLYESQKYEKAGKILDSLVQSRRQIDVLRLAAQVAIRRNRLKDALEYAKEVFGRNRRDTWLLAELARIALTQSQDYIAEELISIARSAHVEDVSILVVEGRMYLRRREYQKAEAVFTRAKQLTHRNLWPFFYLGRAYIELGRIDDAVDVLFDGEQFFHESKSRSRGAYQAIRTQLGLAYLLQDELELAAPIIDSLFQDDPTRPEIIRAYAALTIKRDGITEAHAALKQLEKAKIRTRRDRCQFHLLYGLFYLGIGEKDSAVREFAKAHAADRQNVYVMMKQAQTLFELAKDLWLDGNDSYAEFVDDCANLVREILRFDVDNVEAKDLLSALHSTFGLDA